MLVGKSMRVCFCFTAVLAVVGCATAPGQAADTRLPDQELRRQRTCDQIREQLAMLGFNPARDPFSYPAYRNRELGDPNSPATQIQRLQIAYQRNQCHFR